MKAFQKTILAFGLTLLPLCLNAQQRWTLEDDGPISWHPQKAEVHQDHILAYY